MISTLTLRACDCGACCAAYRVDFAVYELESEGGTVPDGLAVEVTGNTCRMRGTDWQQFLAKGAGA